MTYCEEVAGAGWGDSHGNVLCLLFGNFEFHKYWSDETDRSVQGKTAPRGTEVAENNNDAFYSAYNR